MKFQTIRLLVFINIVVWALAFAINRNDILQLVSLVFLLCFMYIAIVIDKLESYLKKKGVLEK